MANIKELIIIVSPSLPYMFNYSIMIDSNVVYRRSYDDPDCFAHVAYKFVRYLETLPAINRMKSLEDKHIRLRELNCIMMWYDVSVHYNLCPGNVRFTTVAGKSIIPMSVLLYPGIKHATSR